MIADLRPQAGAIPDDPGVYRYRDGAGRVIYVGKAKNLKSRLNSYFADPHSLHPRTREMLTQATSLDWVVVGSEVEALQLEYSWIKEYDPRFNIKYRDDKSYPYLAVTLSEEFPRATVMRGAKRKGTRYFGPYAHAWAIRETVDLLMRVFPMRTCSAGVFRRARAADRPCLLADIGKCSAPCVGRVSAAEHRAIVDDFCAFLAGRHRDFVARLTREMAQAAEAMDYETAARRRDDLAALEKVLSRTAVVFNDDTDADVIAVVDDELEASVQVFHVRSGRVSGQRGFVLEKSADDDTAAMVEAALIRHFGALQSQIEAVGGRDLVPREVLVSTRPEEADLIARWLTGLRGSRVSIREPKRGDKRALLLTARRNAEQALTLHKSRRSGDLTARSQALYDLQETLDLAEAPLRIECFDVSHLSQTNPVAAMVVFEDGLPRTAEYRTYNIRDQQADDLRALRETLTRRYRSLAATEDAPAQDRMRYRPSLVVVDGGAPQVAAAAGALAELGLPDLPVIGLAKRLEEVWFADDPAPLILPRSSDGLFLLQRVRDEAHRFAISAQRRRRRGSVRSSALEAIPGLGPARRRAILRHFGSLANVKAASAEEIADVPGIGPALAETIEAALADPDGRKDSST